MTDRALRILAQAIAAQLWAEIAGGQASASIQEERSRQSQEGEKLHEDDETRD